MTRHDIVVRLASAALALAEMHEGGQMDAATVAERLAVYVKEYRDAMAALDK